MAAFTDVVDAILAPLNPLHRRIHGIGACPASYEQLISPACGGFPGSVRQSKPGGASLRRVSFYHLMI
jgi:hypothetical protein